MGGILSSKNKESVLNRPSKYQQIPGMLPSQANDENRGHQRVNNLGIIKKNNHFNRLNPIHSPGLSPQNITKSRNMNVLTITEVKIDLYKGTENVRTIVDSTSNSGSFTWTVDESLEDSSDYKVRISCISEPDIFGLSKKFNISSGYIFEIKWGKQTSGKYELSRPRKLAVDSAGNVYVADMYNHRIVKFSSSGKYITQWGSYGYGNYQFSFPGGIAVDNSDKVIVADTDNHRIMKFTSSGNFLMQWGGHGKGNYE